MVFNTVTIIYGIQVEFPETDHEEGLMRCPDQNQEELLTIDRFVDYDTENGIDYSNLKIQKGIKIYPPPCCSERNNCFIGTKLRTLYRKHVRCDNCDIYGLCDECLNQTEHGPYPVNSIFNSTVSIPDEHMCLICFSDNHAPFERCKVCNHTNMTRSDTRLTPAIIHELYSFNQWLKAQHIKQVPQFYFVVDDCLSCT